MPQAVVPTPSILMVDGVLLREVFDGDDGVGRTLGMRMRSAKCGVRNAKMRNVDQRRDFAVFPLATKIARSSLISVRRGEQLAEGATFDSSKSSSQYSVSAASFSQMDIL